MSLGRLPRALLSALVGLVLFLVVVEVAMQVYTRANVFYDVEMSRYAAEVKVASPDPNIGHVHRPNVRRKLMGVLVEINADGLRDRDYEVDRNGKRRIAVLGDSLTLGWGVEKEQTFEALLERELDAISPTEVINFGTGNYNTAQEVALFLEKGAKYRPDEVVVFYFINDAEPTPRRSAWAPLGRSRALTFFWSRVYAALSRSNPSRSWERYYSALYDEDQPGWHAARQAFRELHAWCRAEGVGLTVFLLPELHRLRDYTFATEHRAVGHFLEGEGIPVVDLAPFFADVDDPRSLWVARDDAHPSRVAHERIARYALPYLTGETAP